MNVILAASTTDHMVRRAGVAGGFGGLSADACFPPQVPLYSALFTPAQHARLHRMLYVDKSVDPDVALVIDLVGLCVDLRNAGLPDTGLEVHLSKAMTGAWTGA